MLGTMARLHQYFNLTSKPEQLILRMCVSISLPRKNTKKYNLLLLTI